MVHLAHSYMYRILLGMEAYGCPFKHAVIMKKKNALYRVNLSSTIWVLELRNCSFIIRRGWEILNCVPPPKKKPQLPSRSSWKTSTPSLSRPVKPPPSLATRDKGIPSLWWKSSLPHRTKGCHPVVIELSSIDNFRMVSVMSWGLYTRGIACKILLYLMYIWLHDGDCLITTDTLDTYINNLIDRCCSICHIPRFPIKNIMSWGLYTRGIACKILLYLMYIWLHDGDCLITTDTLDTYINNLIDRCCSICHSQGCIYDSAFFSNPIGLEVVAMTTLTDNSDNQRLSLGQCRSSLV